MTRVLRGVLDRHPVATLAGIMLIEKTAPWGKRLVPTVGGMLLVWGALTVLHSGLLPGFLVLSG